jgi:hypothetical protein
MVSIIYQDVRAFGSSAPQKVDLHNHRSASQWNAKGELSEDPDSIVASVP